MRYHFISQVKYLSETTYEKTIFNFNVRNKWVSPNLLIWTPRGFFQFSGHDLLQQS